MSDRINQFLNRSNETHYKIDKYYIPYKDINFHHEYQILTEYKANLDSVDELLRKQNDILEMVEDIFRNEDREVPIILNRSNLTLELVDMYLHELEVNGSTVKLILEVFASSPVTEEKAE